MEKGDPQNIIKSKEQSARDGNIFSAILLGEIVKSTLGPKGMDKLLIDSNGNITITNDGVTILEKMKIEHPIPKIISEIAKTQENEVGDGTTTVTILVGELLRNAKNLMDKGIHPTTIIKGYKLSNDKCQEVLREKCHREITDDILRNVAMTAMTGKVAESHREFLSGLIVQAVKKTNEKSINPEYIKIERIKGESIDKSKLVEGIVLDKKIVHHTMPKKIKDAKIILLDNGLEIKQPEFDTQISVTNPEQLKAFVTNDKENLREMIKKIKSSGCNVIFCKKGIDDFVQNELSKLGIIAVRRLNEYDLKQLSRATNSRILSSYEDIEESVLGYAGLVEEKEYKDGSLLYVSECKDAKSVTLLLCATTSHILDEVRRAVVDGLGDVITCFREEEVVAGGGCIEMILSKELNKFAKTLDSREQLAVVEFARALESIPEILAKNAGLDSINVLTELKQRNENNEEVGINLFTEKIEDTYKAGIIEPLKIKTQAISSASEMTNTILRIDDILYANS